MAPQPLVIEFANTRSSSRRDHIATLAQWWSWVNDWPGLRTVGNAVDELGLDMLRATRDDVQVVLRNVADSRPPPAAAFQRLVEVAGSASGDLRWRHSQLTLVAPSAADAGTVIAHRLALVVIDLLLTGQPLAACGGHDCRKVFVTTRPDRLWCDGAVCGNRARVKAHRDRSVRSDVIR